MMSLAVPYVVVCLSVVLHPVVFAFCSRSVCMILFAFVVFLSLSLCNSQANEGSRPSFPERNPPQHFGQVDDQVHKQHLSSNVPVRVV